MFKQILTNILKVIVQIYMFTSNIWEFASHLKKIIGVRLVYSVVLASAVNQSKPVIHIHIPTPFPPLFFLIFALNALHASHF